MKMSDGMLMILIVILSMFAPLSTDMFLPALDEMVEHFGTTEATFNMSLYMFMLSLAVSILVLGPVSDKYGRRSVLIGSLTLYVVSSLLCSFAPTVEVLIAARILQAAGGGGAMATSMALIRDCFDGSRRTRTLTLVAIIGIIGPVASPILGQVIIWVSGWPATFWAPAVIAVICLLMAFLLPSDIPKDRYKGTVVGALGSMVPIVRNRDFRRFTVMMTMITFCILAYISVSEYIYKDKGFGVGDWYSLYLAFAMILGLLLIVVLMRFKDRLGTRGMLKACFILILFSCVVLWTVGASSPMLFFIGIIPLIGVSSSVRSFGFDILLRQDIGNSGAISSVINFLTFAFATLGMVIVVNLPLDNYVYSVAACVLIYLVVYAALWAVLTLKPNTLKGFDD